MKALSIQEPFATLIMRYGKTTENRTRNCYYRGPLVVCASKTLAVDPDYWDWIGKNAPENLQFHVIDGELELPRNLLPQKFADLRCQPGYALGTVDIVGCDQHLLTAWDMEDQWHIRLANARPFSKPFKQRGALGLYDISDDIVESAR